MDKGIDPGLASGPDDTCPQSDSSHVRFNKSKGPFHGT